jgi:hypothetical protein
MPYLSRQGLLRLTNRGVKLAFGQAVPQADGVAFQEDDALMDGILFVPQCVHGLNTGCVQRRSKACKQCHHRQ